MTDPTENIPNLSRSEILKKIGKTLEDKRKARGLTYEKITQTLKIRSAFIKALEEGDWKELPAEVYARGFLHRYAQLLGLDANEMLVPYFAQENASDKNPAPSPGTPNSPSFPKSGFLWAGVGLLVLIGLIKFITSDQNSSKKSPPAPAKMATKVSPSNETSPPVIRKGQEHRLELFSPLPLWLSVKAENKSFEGFLPQGSTWSWKGEGTFMIRLGHTQQVAMTFDGNAVTLGENQKKVSLPSEN